MITPATSIQIPLRIAQASRLMMMPTIIAMQSYGNFWTVWAEVFRKAK